MYLVQVQVCHVGEGGGGGRAQDFPLYKVSTPPSPPIPGSDTASSPVLSLIKITFFFCQHKLFIYFQLLSLVADQPGGRLI